jgi:transketolase
MISDTERRRLERLAADMRWHIVQMMGPGKAHHFGGSLSAADIMTALYFRTLRLDPRNPRWAERDRFIMSKGHSVPAQYAALAMLGIIGMEELPTLKHLGSRLQGHPAMHETPGIEGCTGALGQGLSYANGMALAGRVLGLSYRVFCLVGDGELQEGQCWEAAMTASRHCLSNVTAILDRNRLKAMDETACSKSMDPQGARWASFGWGVMEVDGHDMVAICDALDWATAEGERPSMIIANTVKGKGISFAEGNAAFHNSVMTPEQFEASLAELSARRATYAEVS